MKTRVVNFKKEAHTFYIGRKRNNKFHFGNPFEMGKGRDGSRKEVIDKFERWLDGDPGFKHIEPERRKYILTNLHLLKGETLGCFCKPLACHGDIYVKMLEEIE